MKNLPCPFCGHRYSHIVKYDGDIWRSCKYCGASTVACSTIKKATAMWNQRPNKKGQGAT